MSISKRLKKVSEGLDVTKTYAVEEAVKLVKARAIAKFDETIELSINLGVDPRHADQMVRGVSSLPAGTGRKLRVAVFAKGAKAEEAKKAVPTSSVRKTSPPKSRPARSTSTAASRRPT